MEITERSRSLEAETARLCKWYDGRTAWYKRLTACLDGLDVAMKGQQVLLKEFIKRG